MTIALLVRAGQLQIVRRAEWSKQADDSLRYDQPIETSRGTLRDCRGVVLAQDVACIDACVDYRALVEPPDEKWLSDTAREWATHRRADEWKARGADRSKILREEKQHILDRISAMWQRLSQLSGESPEQIQETRFQIVREVQMGQRYTWNRKFQLARNVFEQKQDQEDPSPGWWKRWFGDDSAASPIVDDFELTVGEQTMPHPILHGIDIDTQNILGKEIDDLPGFSLRPGMIRAYPNGAEAACHLLGHLAHVDADDLKDDPDRGDALRKYSSSDLAGKTGLEALCEPLLRGTRGRIEHYVGEAKEIVNTTPAVPGVDVNSTLDIDLQEKTLLLFQDAVVPLTFKNGHDDITRQISMHGAAVLIDLRDNAIRALVSNPTYDPNTLDTNYELLVKDALNKPLLSRATQYPLVTGSVIKPLVGLSAITEGVLGVNEGVECTGYLYIDGHRTNRGKCWVVTRLNENSPNGRANPDSVKHHPIPYASPHRGHDGNADGFLTFSDALERSCNIFFETIAHRLGKERLSTWMDKFGLGRATGIGISESHGRLPRDDITADQEFNSYANGIGQGVIAATPLQMANVAATIARNGIWMRPTLLANDASASLRSTLSRAAEHQPPTTQPTSIAWWQMPDAIDLHLSSAGLQAAHLGMWQVVNGDAGTGTELHMDDLTVAGKTGTAQASKYTYLVRDAGGLSHREVLEPSTTTQPSEIAPWYLGFDDGTNLKHAWIIGYAPAKNPQVAFCVMVEYGGSGGHIAARIAKGMLEAAMKDGYLSPDRSAAQASAASVH